MKAREPASVRVFSQSTHEPLPKTIFEHLGWSHVTIIYRLLVAALADSAEARNGHEVSFTRLEDGAPA